MATLRVAFVAATTALKVALLRIDFARARILGDRVSAIEDALEIGRLRGDNGDLPEAIQHFRRAAEEAEQLGDPFWTARSRQLLGSAAVQGNDFEEARELLLSAIPALREGADQRFTLDAVLRLAYVEDKLGQEDDASATLDDAAQIALSIGDVERAIWAFGDRGGIAYRNEDYNRAKPDFAKALELATKARKRGHQAKYTYFLGVVHYHLSQVESARSLLRDSEQLFKRLGKHDLAARAAEDLARIDADRGLSKP